MKAVLVAVLLAMCTTAVAGGGTRRQGAPEDSWLGTANTDDKQRSLLVKCPEGTTADTVEVQPDDQGAVVIVECNFEQ